MLAIFWMVALFAMAASAGPVLPRPTVSPESRDSLSDPVAAERKRKIVALKVKGVLVIVLVGGLTLMMILPMMADAVQGLLPFTGAKLSKTPVIGGLLFSGPSMAKVTSAYLVAAGVYALSVYFWTRLLSIYVDPDAVTDFDADAYKRIITVVGVLVVLADTVLMYVSLAGTQWGKVGVSWVGILFTILYLAGLVAIALTTIHIRKEIRKLEVT